MRNNKYGIPGAECLLWLHDSELHRAGVRDDSSRNYGTVSHSMFEASTELSSCIVVFRVMTTCRLLFSHQPLGATYTAFIYTEGHNMAALYIVVFIPCIVDNEFTTRLLMACQDWNLRRGRVYVMFRHCSRNICTFRICTQEVRLHTISGIAKFLAPRARTRNHRP